MPDQPDIMAQIKAQLPADDTIIALLKRFGGSMKRGTIAKQLKLKGLQRRALRDKLRDMTSSGLISQVGNVVSLPKPLPNQLLLEVYHQTEGFELMARPADKTLRRDGLEIVVEGRLSVDVGDTIEAVLSEVEPGRYLARPLRKVVAEAERPVLGSYMSLGKGKGGQVVPLDPDRIPRRFLVTETATTGDGKEIPDGAIVLGMPIISADQNQAPRLEITEFVGHNAEGLESLIAIHNHNIPYVFPTAVVAEAEGLPETLTDEEVAARDDLRHIPIVTIDGPDARDFDDAVWAEPWQDGGFHAIVAIADVARYIAEHSELDREAYIRGNSVYFPDRVVPMLPEKLSNNLCSLRPNEDRPVLAVHLYIDKTGKLENFKFVRAVIHSHARLTYEQVWDAIQGKFDELTQPLWDVNLTHLNNLYKILFKARAERHALDLDLPEKKVIIGPKGEIAAVSRRERNDAHKLIEELMICANIAAATALENKKAPCLYRVHPAPSGEKLENLRTVLNQHNIKLEKLSGINPEHIASLIAEIQGRPEEELLMQMVLRAQQQAVYTPENKGHFGLALQKYAHFTSPIRRYSDLVVHRSLIRAYKMPGKGALETPAKMMAEVGDHLCITERRAQHAEWDAKDRLITRFYQDKLGQQFEAQIISVLKFGMFVTIDDGVAEGLIPMSYLGTERFNFTPQTNTLTGQRSGRSFKVGDRVEVTLVEANVMAGQLTFAIGKVEPDTIRQNRSRRGKPPAGRHAADSEWQGGKPKRHTGGGKGKQHGKKRRG